MLTRLGGLLVGTGLVCALFLGAAFAFAGSGLMVIGALLLAPGLEEMLKASEAPDAASDAEAVLPEGTDIAVQRARRA